MPGGQPTKLDQVVRFDDDGQAVTAGEEIIDRVRLAADVGSACDSAGISRVTLHNWRLEAGRARATVAQGGKLTAKRARLIEFLNALDRAEAEAEMNRVAIISDASRPQVTERVVERFEVQRNADGTTTETVVERTVTRTVGPGAWQPAAWWLERRLPSKYGRKERIEHTGPDGEPIAIEVRAARIREAAEQLDASRPELTVVAENGQVNG